MDKKILAVVGAVVVVLVVCLFLFIKPKTNLTPVGAPKEEAGGTMEQIYNLGKNLKCEAISAEGQKIILYIYGQKMKIIMPMPDSDKDFIYSIYDGEFVYGWQNAQKEGTKFKISQQDYFKPSPSEAVQEDFSKTLDYKCTAWVVDSHEFDLPADVSFQDMTGIVEEAQKANTAALEKMCKTCTSMQGEERVSCETQFCTQE